MELSLSLSLSISLYISQQLRNPNSVFHIRLQLSSSVLQGWIALRSCENRLVGSVEGTKEGRKEGSGRQEGQGSFLTSNAVVLVVWKGNTEEGEEV
jgi:hypothetical protein